MTAVRVALAIRDFGVEDELRDDPEGSGARSEQKRARDIDAARRSRSRFRKVDTTDPSKRDTAKCGQDIGRAPADEIGEPGRQQRAERHVSLERGSPNPRRARPRRSGLEELSD